MTVARTEAGRPHPTAVLAALLAAATLGTVIGAPAAHAKKAKAHPAKSPIIMAIRAVCAGTPVSVAAVKRARKPVRVGTVTYALGSFKESYEVTLAPNNTAVAWSGAHPGEGFAAESGTIPNGAFGGIQNGHVRLAVARAGDPPPPAGVRRVPLFSHFDPMCLTVLLISAKPAPAKPVHSQVTIQGQGMSSPEPSKGTASSPVKWMEGAAGYAKGIKGHKSAKKAMALYFVDASPAVKQFESDVFSACKVGEFLHAVVPVRINVTKGKGEQAIAAKYGVRSYPTFMMLPAGSEQGRIVFPLQKKPGKGKGGNFQPCGFVELCENAIKK